MARTSKEEVSALKELEFYCKVKQISFYSEDKKRTFPPTFIIEITF